MKIGSVKLKKWRRAGSLATRSFTTRNSIVTERDNKKYRSLQEMKAASDRHPVANMTKGAACEFVKTDKGVVQHTATCEFVKKDKGVVKHTPDNYDDGYFGMIWRLLGWQICLASFYDYSRCDSCTLTTCSSSTSIHDEYNGDDDVNTLDSSIPSLLRVNRAIQMCKNMKDDDISDITSTPSEDTDAEDSDDDSLEVVALQKEESKGNKEDHRMELRVHSLKCAKKKT